MVTPTYLAKSDFKGRLNIDFGNYDDFNNFAIEIEDMYSLKLLGFEVKTALEAAPSTTKYSNLINGIAAGWEDDDGYTKQLKGMKEMLKCFFYFHFVIEEQDPRTNSGDPQEAYIQAVNGSKQIKNRQIINAWNQGIDYYNELLAYIDKTEGDTPDTYENWTFEELEKINTFGI